VACPFCLGALPGFAKFVDTMTKNLPDVLRTLRMHQEDLRRLGVSHAAVFGSVARGDSTIDSDVDVMVELDRSRPMGVFEYVRVKLYIAALFEGATDVVNRGRSSLF
jgi:predicted nucleotidyltransferase